MPVNHKEKPYYMISSLARGLRIIELLAESDLRHKVKVLVGGAPVHQAWADAIGADGYGENAVMAVKETERLKRI